MYGVHLFVHGRAPRKVGRGGAMYDKKRSFARARAREGERERKKKVPRNEITEFRVANGPRRDNKVLTRSYYSRATRYTSHFPYQCRAHYDTTFYSEFV